MIKLVFLVVLILAALTVIYFIWRPGRPASPHQEAIRFIRAYRAKLLQLEINFELRENILEWVEQAEALYETIEEYYSDKLISILPDDESKDLESLAESLKKRQDARAELVRLIREAETDLQQVKIDLGTLYTRLRTPRVIYNVSAQRRMAQETKENIQILADRLEALQEVKL